MRERPKLVMPHPGDEFSTVIHLVYRNLEVVLAWVEEAVEEIDSRVAKKDEDEAR